MKKLFFLTLAIMGLTSCSPYYYNSHNRSAVYTQDGRFSHVRYSGQGNSYKNGVRTRYSRTPTGKCHRDWK